MKDYDLYELCKNDVYELCKDYNEKMLENIKSFHKELMNFKLKLDELEFKINSILYNTQYEIDPDKREWEYDGYGTKRWKHKFSIEYNPKITK